MVSKRKEEGFWSADAKTFGITGLAHFPEGSDTGYIVCNSSVPKKLRQLREA